MLRLTWSDTAWPIGHCWFPHATFVRCALPTFQKARAASACHPHGRRAVREEPPPISFTGLHNPFPDSHRGRGKRQRTAPETQSIHTQRELVDLQPAQSYPEPVGTLPTRGTAASPEQGGDHAVDALPSSAHLLPHFRAPPPHLALLHHISRAPAAQRLAPVPPHRSSTTLSAGEARPAEPTHPLSEVKNTKVVFSRPFSCRACSSCPTEPSNSESASPNGPRSDWPA